MLKDLFLRIIRFSLWGSDNNLQVGALEHKDFNKLTKIATEQAVMGLLSQGLIDANVRLEREDALNLFALQQSIRRQNNVIDQAVVSLCKEMTGRNIKIFVFKGQPLARSYSDAGLRQSGDIDFFCFPEDWQNAIQYFKEELKLPLNDLYTEKDVEFQMNRVAYEMHCKLTLFSNPWHGRYWEKNVMPEIISHLEEVDINSCSVPTLSPTYNVLYVFTHIYQHLISDGIGLRQFCDLAVLIHRFRDNIDVELLEKHLKGIGMKKAFLYCGALLTDSLGLSEDVFPFKIPEKFHRKQKMLLDNIFEMGNFGRNLRYKNRPGISHGIEHLGRIARQSMKFGQYAPSEAYFKIPYMFKWWAMKISRMVRK